MIAYDSAYASNRATADVTIRVLRNVNGPIFVPSATYEITVSETTSIGTGLVTVLAQDRDDGVSHMDMVISIFQPSLNHRLMREKK